MLYKYIYFKLYKWAWKSENQFYPNLGAIYFLSLLILSNTYLILVLLDSLGIYKYNGKYIYNSSAEILIIAFISALIFNHLYFFWIYKWRDIINYFRKNNADTKLKILSNVYIIFSIGSFLILYLFNIK
jgi:hypothetical protein